MRFVDIIPYVALGLVGCAIGAGVFDIRKDMKDSRKAKRLVNDIYKPQLTNLLANLETSIKKRDYMTAKCLTESIKVQMQYAIDDCKAPYFKKIVRKDKDLEAVVRRCELLINNEEYLFDVFGLKKQ